MSEADRRAEAAAQNLTVAATHGEGPEANGFRHIGRLAAEIATLV